MTTRNILLGVLLAASAACKESGDPEAEQLVASLEARAEAVASAGDDCVQMAANLEAVARKYDLPAIQQWQASKRGALAAPYQRRIEQAAAKLTGPGLAKCADHPALNAVRESLGG